MLGVSQPYAGSTIPWERAHHPGSVLSPTGGVPTLDRTLQPALSSACGTPKQHWHCVTTNAFLLPSPSNHKEVGGEKYSPLDYSSFRSEVTLTRLVPGEGGGPDAACEGLLLPTEQPQTLSRGSHRELVPIKEAQGC